MARRPSPSLFSLTDALALTATPLQAHVVWLGEVAGRVYGLVTSPIGGAKGVDEGTIRRHALASAVQRCFLSEEFVALMDVATVDLDRIFDEVSTVGLGTANIRVAGNDVTCCTLAYRDLEFASGYDQLRWPFTLARRFVEGEPWPSLVMAGVRGDRSASSS